MPPLLTIKQRFLFWTIFLFSRQRPSSSLTLRKEGSISRGLWMKISKKSWRLAGSFMLM